MSGCTLACFVLGLFGLPLPVSRRRTAESARIGQVRAAGNYVVARQSGLREVLANLIRPEPEHSACCCGQDARRAGRCCCRKTTASRPATRCTDNHPADATASGPASQRTNGSRHSALTACGCGFGLSGILTSAEPQIIGPPVGVISHPVPWDSLLQTVPLYAGPAFSPDPPHPRFITRDNRS